MSIDLNSLSAKELDALINQAKKRKTTLTKRKPLAVVRQKLTALARAEGYSIAELFGAGSSAKPAPAPRASAPAPRAASWARSRRNTATRPIPPKPGPAAASSRNGSPRKPARAGRWKSS